MIFWVRKATELNQLMNEEFLNSFLWGQLSDIGKRSERKQFEICLKYHRKFNAFFRCQLFAHQWHELYPNHKTSSCLLEIGTSQ